MRRFLSLAVAMAIFTVRLCGAESNTMSVYEQRMREAGFTPENCQMKGRFMCGAGVTGTTNFNPKCYRKIVTLPSDARWAKCSVATYGPVPGRCGAGRVYVNGKLAFTPLPIPATPYGSTYDLHLYNYELDPKLFHKGDNVIAAEHESAYGVVFKGILVDGSALCTDGTLVRFDSDDTWKFKEIPKAQPEYGQWTKAEYDDGVWGKVEVTANQPPGLARLASSMTPNFFNPSYKGLISVSPADRAQPVFVAGEPITLEVAVPRRAGENHEIAYQMFDEMGDGFHAADRLVKEGTIKFGMRNAERGMKSPYPDAVGVLSFPAGALASNAAYAVVLSLKANGQEIEKRRYEIAVCGPIMQPVVDDPTTYTNGMDLKLVWEVDAAAEPRPGEFVCANQNGHAVASKVITTPLGSFRQPGGGTNAAHADAVTYLCYRYSVEHPGRPHVAIGEYPDDTCRVQEMRLTENFPDRRMTLGQNQLGNNTVMLGIENPLTQRMGYHTVVFFPNEISGGVGIFSTKLSGLTGDTAPRIGKMRIYEILNDIPMRRMNDAPGAPKWIGQMAEAGPRQMMQSCFASPIAVIYRYGLLGADTPNFYRNWLVTYMNAVKRLRFAGDNAYFSGQFQYTGTFWPSVYPAQAQLGTDGSLRDNGVLMSKVFEQNGMGWFTSFQLIAVPDGSEKAHYTDEEVANGADTVVQVDKDGKQLSFFEPVPNWIRPEGRKHIERLFDELLGLYGKEKGWKGVYMQINEFDGPCWLNPTATDPYTASYDDYTIREFQKDTGVRIPVDAKDPKRFNKRYTWLMANAEAKKQWTDWRCRKMNEVYDWIAARLKKARPDLAFVLYPQTGSVLPPAYEKSSDAFPSIYDYARRSGLDLQYLKKHKDIVLAMNVPGNQDINAMIWSQAGYQPVGRSVSREDRCIVPFANDGKNGVSVRINWTEPDVLGPKDWIWYYSETESWPVNAGDYAPEFHVNSFIRANPTLMANPLTDYVFWMGRETTMSRFAKAFRSVPAARYDRLVGNGRDRNVWIETATWGKDVYGYVANPQWWALDAKIEFAAGATAVDLMADKPVAGSTWTLRMGPYSVHTFRLTGAAADKAVESCATEVSNEGRNWLAALVQAEEVKVAQNRGVLANAGTLPDIEAVLRNVRSSIAAGDCSAAADLVMLYPQKLGIRSLQMASLSANITEGWSVSKLLPKRGGVAEAPPVSLGDDLGWRLLRVVPGEDRVNLHSVFQNEDGMVCLAQRFKVAQAGKWVVGLGHDGAVRVFVDGKPVFCEPVTRPPIGVDRSQFPLEFTEGEHEVVVAFDLAAGKGWGMRFRFKVPDGQERIQAVFPAPMGR